MYVYVCQLALPKYLLFGLLFARLPRRTPKNPYPNQQHPRRDQTDGGKDVASGTEPQRLESLGRNIPSGAIDVHPASAIRKAADIMRPHHDAVAVSHVQSSGQELASLQPSAVDATPIADRAVRDEDSIAELPRAAHALPLKLRRRDGIRQHANGTLCQRPHVYQHDSATLLAKRDDVLA